MAKTRKTNLKVRGYAAERGVTFVELANHMKILPSKFSTMYMSRELLEEDQQTLMRLIDEVVENNTKRAQ